LKKKKPLRFKKIDSLPQHGWIRVSKEAGV
jgi:hypothetical protein